MLMLYVNIKTTNLFNATDALYPEEQLCLLFRPILVVHAISLVCHRVALRVCARVTDVIVVHPLIALCWVATGTL